MLHGEECLGMLRKELQVGEMKLEWKKLSFGGILLSITLDPFIIQAKGQHSWKVRGAEI